MTHPSVEEVALHLEGVLDPADEQRVHAHLEHCADCAATAHDLRDVTEQLHAAAQLSESESQSSGSSEPSPHIPTDVAARVEAALAREANERSAEAVTASEEVPAETAVAAATVGDLAERRRRRRRVLSGGLLAAAAATVVAVGLGQLVQNGGPGQASQAESATAGRPESGLSAQRGTVPGGPQASSLSADGRGHDESAGKRPGGKPVRGIGPGTLAFEDRLRDIGLDVGLIEGVAAAHSPDQARHDRPDCVRAALGDDLGPVASYAVRLPEGGGAPGVVVLRPSQRPTVGVLVACTSQPHVLARRGLQP